MNLIKQLTPEQIQALTPECLQLLCSQNTKSDDIAKMKYYFKQLKYNNGYPRYIENEAASLRKLLLKYPHDNFYITYEESFDSWKKICNSNYELHTVEEIKEKLPTGVDIQKLCFSGEDHKRYQNSWFCKDNSTKKEIKFIECPLGYDKEIKDGKIEYIAQLTHCHNNIHIVHPKLLQAARYFYEG
jgi:hypothetical protein